MSAKQNILNILAGVYATPARFGRAASRVHGGVNNDDIGLSGDNNDDFEANDMHVTYQDEVEVEGGLNEEQFEEVIDESKHHTVDSVHARFNAIGGTSNPDSNRVGTFLFLHTEGLEDENAGILPTSNTRSSGNSQRVDVLSARSGDTGRTDLLSARSNNTNEQSVSWEGGTIPENTFGVFEVPIGEHEYSHLCRKKIGNGTRMCIRKDCRINHRGGGELVEVVKGDIFVKNKTSDMLFLEPSTKSSCITYEVLIQWFTTKKTIEEWSVLFALANNTPRDEVLTSNAITSGTIFASLAKNHKSPNARVVSSFEQPFDSFARLLDKARASGLDESLFSSKKRSFSEDDLDNDSTRDRRRKFSDELDQSASNARVNKLNEAVNQVYKILEFLTQKLDEKDEAITEEVHMLFSRIEMVQSDLGTRSTSRTDRLEAPTIWSSIALLSGTIEEMHRDIPSVPTTLEWKSLLMKEVDRLEKGAAEAVNLMSKDLKAKVAAVVYSTVDDSDKRDSEVRILSNRLSTLTRDYNGTQASADVILLKLAEGAAMLKAEIEELRRQARGSPQRGSVAPSGNNCSNYVPLSTYQLKMASIDIDMSTLNSKVSQLLADSKGKAIRSFGLGFRDRRASEEWLVANMKDDSFGLFVDVHLVFEQLNHMVNAEGADTLKTLHSIQKLDLDNMNQALCVTSFDTRVPKMLSKSSNMAPPSRTGKGVSHFDQVKDFSEWDGANGMRERIKDNLVIFEFAHLAQIEANTDENSLGRLLTTKSLDAAVLWLNNFVVYIDATFKNFTALSAFTDDKAWELTTQLGRRIFIEVAVPRNGISTAVRVGPNAKRHLNKLLFWPMLLSHDLMRDFREAKFQNHPTISSEYVKFLVANAGSERKDRELVSLREELVAITKIAKDALAASSRACNTVDEQKKKIAELETRITKKEREGKK